MKWLPVGIFSFLLLGCGLIPKLSGGDSEPVTEKKEYNPAYYYYAASQIQKKHGGFDHSILLLQKAIEKDPETVFLRYELTRLLISQQDNGNALRVVEEILSRRPREVEALKLKGRIFQNLNREEDAKKTYERIITVEPKHEDTYVLLGKIYMDSGESDKALRVYERLIENFPESYLGYFFIGKLLSDQGKLEAAEEKFKTTIRLAPWLEEPKFELLKLYELQGREDKKLEVFQDVLAKDPENVEIQMELALYYAKTGKSKESGKILEALGRRSSSDRTIVPKIAQKYLEKENYEAAIIILSGMLRGDSSNSDINYLMGLAKDGTGDKADAIGYFGNVKPDSRFFENATLHVAFLYHEWGKIDDAIVILKKAATRLRSSADLYYYLGSFYEEADNLSESEATFLEGLKIAPDNVRIHFRLGVIYDKKGDREGAIREMKRVVELDPDHSNALNYIGYSYAEMGIDLDEAERLVLLALKNQPNDGYIIDSLGWVYFKKGLYEQAVSILEKAISLVPDDPTILEHMGDACVKVNQTERALEFYKKSLERREKDKEVIEEKIRVLMQRGK